MINLGLTPANQLRLNALFGQPHYLQIGVQILDLNHNRLSDVSPQFDSGQINIDNTQAVTRGGDLTFFDPYHQMGLDAYSPSDGALFIDRMLQVYYTVISPTYDFRVSIPVFCGPITKVDRDWAFVKCEVKGKETLALNNSWRAKTYKKGAGKVSVIRDIFLTLMGEKKYSLPDLASRLPNDMAISYETKPWEAAKAIANGLGYQLFYDGRGVAVMRKYNPTSLWTFHDHSGGTVTTKPQVGYDLSNLINGVRITGATINGTTKTPFYFTKVAPATHPLSPWSIGRGGVPRVIFDKIEDDTINSTAEANAVADDRLAIGLLQPITVSFNSMTVPILEEGDVYRLQTPEFNTVGMIQQMSIPLLATDTSSVGYLRRMAPNRNTIRSNRK